MTYRLQIPEHQVYGKGKFANGQGEVKPRTLHTQRAEFPRTNAAKHDYYVIE